MSAHITCYLCRQPGHYASVCPKATTQFQEMQMNFSQRAAFLDSDEWGEFSDDDGDYDPICQEIQHLMGSEALLIDSRSTFNSFNSESLLSDITSCDGMRAYSNGGSLDYHEIGSVKKFPAISAYFNPHSLANILSLANVSQFYCVTMDTQQCNCLIVHTSENEGYHFIKCGAGLYRLDSRDAVQSTTSTPPLDVSDNQNNQTISDYSFFFTVASNKEFVSRLKIEGADKARILQSRLGWPSDQQYKEAIRDNLIMNADVTIDDINRAEAIYGKAVPLIKGKMVRKRPKHLSDVPRVELPLPLLKHHPSDELDIDFLYIQGAPYLLTKTRKIKFQSVQCFNRISSTIKSKPKSQQQRITYKRGPKEIIAGIKKVIDLYHRTWRQRIS